MKLTLQKTIILFDRFLNQARKINNSTFSKSTIDNSDIKTVRCEWQMRAPLHSAANKEIQSFSLFPSYIVHYERKKLIRQFLDFSGDLPIVAATVAHFSGKKLLKVLPRIHRMQF